MRPSDCRRYYLTKADTVARREDLNKVIVQVTQNLSLRVANTHGFDVPCIWIPSEAAALVPHTPGAGIGSPAGGSGGSGGSNGTSGATLEFADHRTVAGEVNSLGRLCNDISRTIATKVQANMTACGEDCKALLDHIDKELEREGRAAGVKRTWRCYMWALRPWFLILGLLTFLDVLHHLQDRLPSSIVGAPLTQQLLGNSAPVISVLREGLSLIGFPTLQQRLTLGAGAFLVVAILVQFFACRTRGLRTRNGAQLLELQDRQNAVELMRRKVTTLYQEYVRAAQVPEYNFVSPAASQTPAGGAASGKKKAAAAANSTSDGGSEGGGGAAATPTRDLKF